MPLPLSDSAVIRPKHRRGGSPDPPANFGAGFIPRGGFRPEGRVSFPTMGKKPKDRRGKTHIAVGNKFPPAPVRSPPGPPFTGDTPIPSCNISGAQNMVPGMIPPGPLGPGAAQNFGLCHFTAAPRFDQPWQRVRDRGCAGRGRSHGAGTGGHRGPPLRGNRENVLQQGTGGHRGSPALCGP